MSTQPDVSLRTAFLERLSLAERGNRALDWRVYAHAVNKEAAARLGYPGLWAPEDFEDREFKRYARIHQIPKYTTQISAAKTIEDEEIRAAVLELLRPSARKRW